MHSAFSTRKLGTSTLLMLSQERALGGATVSALADEGGTTAARLAASGTAGLVLFMGRPRSRFRGRIP
jgi:hypothetical protein